MSDNQMHIGHFRKTNSGLAICPFFTWTSEDIGGAGHSENDVNLVHCVHPDNKESHEGNCQQQFCPFQAQPCATCGDSGFIPQNQGHNTVVDIPCPVCQQPPAGEFVKNARKRIATAAELIDEDISSSTCRTVILENLDRFSDACDHLDQQAETIDALTQARAEAREYLLLCKCGWTGSVDDQDALGSECGCCPDCGNEDLVFQSEACKTIAALTQARETQGERIEELEHRLKLCHEGQNELIAKNQEIYDYLYEKGIKWPANLLVGIKKFESQQGKRIAELEAESKNRLGWCANYEADLSAAKKEIERLTTLKKMCQAIVKYNETRHPDSEQFLIRRDMFQKIEQALEQKGGSDGN